MFPPRLPPNPIYTRLWCEENVYRLVESVLADDQISKVWDSFAVFISNDTKTVAVWQQKLGKGNQPVIWDYHVILVLRPRQLDISAVGFPGSWVYDFDTLLPFPSEAAYYISQSFYQDLPAEYQSRFRVVPGQEFMDNFASDRSHMLFPVEDKPQNETPKYLASPPSYPPLCGRKAREMGITNNLMSEFVCMTNNSTSYGEILEIDEFLWWSRQN